MISEESPSSHRALYEPFYCERASPSRDAAVAIDAELALLMNRISFCREAGLGRYQLRTARDEA